MITKVYQCCELNLIGRIIWKDEESTLSRNGNLYLGATVRNQFGESIRVRFMNEAAALAEELFEMDQYIRVRGNLRVERRKKTNNHWEETHCVWVDKKEDCGVVCDVLPYD